YVKANMNGGAESEDPYTLGLVANAMVYLADPAASDVLARLDASKQSAGDRYSWKTSLQTNFYGAGHEAHVAATALVTPPMPRGARARPPQRPQTTSAPRPRPAATAPGSPPWERGRSATRASGASTCPRRRWRRSRVVRSAPASAMTRRRSPSTSACMRAHASR